MIKYYERRAPWHDQYMSYSGNENMERLFKPVIEKIDTYISQKNIIEIACGTGNWTQVLARKAKHVYAVDSSPKSLELACDKLKSLKNINLDIADAYNLEKINTKYDVAFIADFFSHIPKKMINRFLDGIKSVLKPEGWCIILEMSNKEEFYEYFDCFVDDNDDLINTRQLPDGNITEVVKNFYSENDLREILKNHSNEILFHNFEELKRCVVIFKLN